jgi:hypothetical protein
MKMQVMEEMEKYGRLRLEQILLQFKFKLKQEELEVLGDRTH